MAGISKRKQAWHDKTASTVVVYKDQNKKSSGLVVGLIVGFCFTIPVIGILASIVLASLSGARNNANS